MQPIKRIIKQNTGLHFLVDITCLNTSRRNLLPCVLSAPDRRGFIKVELESHIWRDGSIVSRLCWGTCSQPARRSTCLNGDFLFVYYVIWCSVISLMFCSDLLEGAVCYLFISSWGGCLCICLQFGGFIVKPTLIFLIISGGSQGFCSQWTGEYQSSPITHGRMDGVKSLLFNIFIIDLKNPCNSPGWLSLLWPQKWLERRTFPNLGHH